jgi:hypothetical protein
MSLNIEIMRSAPRWHVQLRRRMLDDGILAELWKPIGSDRGSSTPLSVLLTLSLYGRQRYGKAAAEWTNWFLLSSRRLSEVAGVSRDTVKSGRGVLQRMGIVEHRKIPTEGGLYCSEYRVAVDWYPREEEPFAMLPARLFLGGLWCSLTDAERLVLVGAACADVIQNDAAYKLAGNGSEHVREPDAIRAERARPLSDLRGALGLSRGVFGRALAALLTPREVFSLDGQPKTLPLLRRGFGLDSRTVWLSLNQDAMQTCTFPARTVRIGREAPISSDKRPFLDTTNAKSHGTTP